MMKKDIYTAVIPVRAGSKRLKNKNILPFGDSNLLIHKIRQLKKVTEIDNIVVSSDSDEMLEMAIAEGCIIQKRPLEYSDEITKTFNEVVYHIISSLEEGHIIWTPCVCPLVDEDLISLAIRKYKETVIYYDKYDSLVSVKLLKEYIWDSKQSLNYKADNHLKSQDLPNWYSIINGFYIASKEIMLESSYFFGNKPYLYEIDKIAAVDIDDEYDLEIARALYSYINK